MEPGFALRRSTPPRRTRPGCTTPSSAARTTMQPTAPPSARCCAASRSSATRRGPTGRSCTGRSGSWLAEAGIRQIIDIGTGIPAAGNVHEVAGQAAPGTRVVYVDNDPIVHVHANALLTGSGTTSIVLADLRDPEAILAHPKAASSSTSPSRSPCCWSRSCTSSPTRRTRPGSWPRCATRCPPAATWPCRTAPVTSARGPRGRPPPSTTRPPPRDAAQPRAGRGVLRGLGPDRAGPGPGAAVAAATASRPGRRIWTRSGSTAASAAGA